MNCLSDQARLSIFTRQALDAVLSTPAWCHLGELWDDQKRQGAVTVWHKLNGAFLLALSRRAFAHGRSSFRLARLIARAIHPEEARHHQHPRER